MSNVIRLKMHATNTIQLIRTRLDDAFQAGFPLMRLLPSTNAWRTLGYLYSLTADKRSSVFDACARVAYRSLHCAMTDSSGLFDLTDAERTRLDGALSAQYWTHFPNRFLRQFSAIENGLTNMVPPDRVSKILAEPVGEVAKAPAIRKQLKSDFKSAFASKPRNLGGGTWQYTGALDNASFSLFVDYGGNLPGFKYGLTFDTSKNNCRTTGNFSLESTYGFSVGTCDFVLADELDQLLNTFIRIADDIVELLCQFLARTSG